MGSVREQVQVRLEDKLSFDHGLTTSVVFVVDVFVTVGGEVVTTVGALSADHASNPIRSPRPAMFLGVHSSVRARVGPKPP